MAAFEVLISESQERMLAVVRPELEDAVREVCRRWGIPCATIGVVTADGDIAVRETGVEIVRVPARYLTSEAIVHERLATPPQRRRSAPAPGDSAEQADRLPERGMDPGAVLSALLGSPNLASRRAVFEQYDSTVQVNTVVGPGHGAAVLRVKGTAKALVASTDANAAVGLADPWLGAAMSVAEATRNVSITGATPLGVTNCLNYGDPTRPEAFWQLSEAVRGLGDACRALGLPVTGGNVSLYNESPAGAILPTPEIGVVGLVHDVATLVGPGFVAEGDTVVLVGEAQPGLEGSEYARLGGWAVEDGAPPLDLDRERAVQDFVREGDRARVGRLGPGRERRRAGRGNRRGRHLERSRGDGPSPGQPLARGRSLRRERQPPRDHDAAAARPGPRAPRAPVWPAGRADRYRGRRAAGRRAGRCRRDRRGGGARLDRRRPDRRRARRPQAHLGPRAGTGPRLGGARVGAGGSLTMCGVFAAALPKGSGTEAANVAALGLFSLQHRGQESAGLAVSDGAELFLYKDLGMISSVLDERRLPSFRGDLAIAHCRYSTTGSTVWENAQPTLRLGPRRAVAIGHNGNLVNTRELLGQLKGGRGRLPATTDTELLTALLADEPGADTVEALVTLLPRVRGAYSLVILDKDRILGVRDPHGFRPLCIGRIRDVAAPVATPGGLWGDDAPVDGPRDAWVLSSETTGLDIVGAEYVRDVEPGEIVVLQPGREPVSVRFAVSTPALCVFELIYFARPDSYLEGRSLYEARRRMGFQLAMEHPVDTDMVMPVPDTGGPAAAGYAEASGIPYREGLIRNRYTGRTFIQPSQTLRHRGVTLKLNPLREVVRGQRLTVVDDSIVRGTTTKQIVALLRRAGAAEVHVRISAPPIYHPCFYGIDTQVETELIAATNSVEQIREFIGADSLGYLSIGGVLAALDLPYDRFCFACFDGNYPEPVPYDVEHRKFVLEEPVLAGG